MVVQLDTVRRYHNSLSVGIGEYIVSSDPSAVITCLGLGSCIAVCGYAVDQRLALMLHVALPIGGEKAPDRPAKYADTAIPLLINELTSRNIPASRVRIALVGGAAIFQSLVGLMDIGQRNLDAVRQGLIAHGMRPISEAVGGNESRTVTLDVASGALWLRTLRTGENVLADLGAR